MSLVCILFLLLFHCTSATVHLEASWLGDPSLFPQSDFTMLLFNLTSATSVSLEPASVDMLLGKQARNVFPNASTVYSFSIVYITRLQCELETLDDVAALYTVRRDLVSGCLRANLGHLVLDYASLVAREKQRSAWEWPDYVAPLAVSGWSVTTFVCVVLLLALCTTRYYADQQEEELDTCRRSSLASSTNLKSAKAPSLRVPQYAGRPSNSRELLLKIPAPGTRR